MTNPLAPKPKPTYYTAVEGGPWIAWNATRVGHFHAIKFEDGSILDIVNGWRPLHSPDPELCRVLEKLELAIRRIEEPVNIFHFAQELAEQIAKIIQEHR